MIKTEKLLKCLKKSKVNFFTGVPDSVLKKLSLYLDKKKKNQHIIATNEGSAVSLGIGYYLAKKKIAAVYLQNSGLGNAINPLVSIAHKKVYSIPLLLIIGWRGFPGQKDEPQHQTKGAITKKILNLLDIKTIILKHDSELNKLKKLISFAKKNKKPVACLIQNNILSSNKKKIFNTPYPEGIKRYFAIEKILKLIKKNTKIISTTGFTSRELYQVRKNKQIFNGKDFYMVGGMGHSAMVALGNSIFSKTETVCLDGDGSALMHLGSLSLCGNYGGKYFKYILLNNSSHESVGGQLTLAKNINFKKISSSFGFRNFFHIDNIKNLEKKLKIFLKSKGPSFLEIKIKNETLKNLQRPKNLQKIKEMFLKA